MSAQLLTYIVVFASFALYIGIAIWARARTTADFYVAGKSVSPLANGMATAADWMSAASFLSMAGLIAFLGKDGSVYLMGWTGGYVLLALLLAPYLRKFGKFTVPDFIGERYYSRQARLVAVLCLIFISFTYVAGQMRGVGIVFSRFLEIEIELGVLAGMTIVFFYFVLGGMKGITYTQVAQYCVLIFAYLVPAIFISLLVTGNPVPQLGFGDQLLGSSVYLLDKLDQVTVDLGFTAYTESTKSTIDIFCITAALMMGTAGLPHVIVRFFTVPKVADARKSVGYALLFIAILYTTAPAVAAFARINLVDSIQNQSYAQVPQWFKNWESIGLIGWLDKNDDGVIRYEAGQAFTESRPIYGPERAPDGHRLLLNQPDRDNANEIYIDRDIIVMANPEIAELPAWVVALVAAGALAAALSTAAGLLLVIASAISHDLMKSILLPRISEKQELLFARLAAAVVLIIAGFFGIYPPAFVAQVVAFAFGLAAATLFPALLLGIFTHWANREGVIAGMCSGLALTASYIVYFKFLFPELNHAQYWWWGISPEGIGFVGMLLNFAMVFVVSLFTPKPPKQVAQMVQTIRQP
ncbi:MAG: sodium:solute symporter family protein [Gammaproteobacteria bacterium]